MAAKLGENQIKTPSIPANELLQTLLDKHNLEILLTPFTVRQVEMGAVLIEKPQVQVQYKQPQN